MASWAELLTVAEPGEHVVHLYGEDDRLLARNVSRYLMEGLRRGDGLVVIATPEHTQPILRHLVAEEPEAVQEAMTSGRFRTLDAGETLVTLQQSGVGELDSFRSAVGGVLAEVRARSTTGSVRAFGEMVALLWQDGKHEEAALLEDTWNAVLAEHRCSLLCAYPIDLFDGRHDATALHPIICTHHYLLGGSGTVLSSGLPRP
jgi:hypothetical protein